MNNSIEVSSLPLVQKRKILGILIPAINLPLFIWNLYQMFVFLSAEGSSGSLEFLNLLIMTIIPFLLGFVLPTKLPVYKSQYWLTDEELKLERLLKGSVTIPCSSIDRAEIFIKVDETTSEAAEEYAKDESNKLRKSGFKFKDYTNSEDVIMMLFYGQQIYMISPERPKGFLKELKKRSPKLIAKIVELRSRGKTVRELQ